MLYIRIKLQFTVALCLFAGGIGNFADILFCLWISQMDIYNFDVHYQYVSKATVFSISSENLVVLAIVSCRHIFCGRVNRDCIIEHLR